MAQSPSVVLPVYHLRYGVLQNLCCSCDRKLLVLPYAKVHRLPALILKGPKNEENDSGEAASRLEWMRSKDYHVETVPSEGTETWNVSNASSYIFEWFERVSLERDSSREARSSGLKEKFFQWLDNLLQNR